MSQEVSLKELVDYYVNVFVKSYADLVALTASKPTQILIEIENFNSHLLVALKKEESDEIINSNLRKAKTHLQRGTLDCYKMLFIKINEQVNHFLKDLTIEDVHFAIGDQYTSCLNNWIKFSENIQATRRLEVASTGTQQIDDVIEQYRAAVQVGYSVYILTLQNASKLAHVRKHLFFHSLKSHWPFHAIEISLAAIIGAFLKHLA